MILFDGLRDCSDKETKSIEPDVPPVPFIEVLIKLQISAKTETTGKRDNERYRIKLSCDKLWVVFYIRPSCHGNPKRKQGIGFGKGFTEFITRCRKQIFPHDTRQRGTSIGGGNFWCELTHAVLRVRDGGKYSQ